MERTGLIRGLALGLPLSLALWVGVVAVASGMVPGWRAHGLIGRAQRIAASVARLHASWG